MLDIPVIVQVPVMFALLSSLVFALLFPLIPGFKVSKHYIWLSLFFGPAHAITLAAGMFIVGLVLYGAVFVALGGGAAAALSVVTASICVCLVAVFGIIVALLRALAHNFPDSIKMEFAYTPLLAALVLVILEGLLVYYLQNSGTLSTMFQAEQQRTNQSYSDDLSKQQKQEDEKRISALEKERKERELTCVRSWRDGNEWAKASAANYEWLLDCDTFLAKTPNHAPTIALRAAINTASYDRQYDAAERDARKALGFDSQCALSRAVLGEVLSGSGKYGEAEKEFSQAIKIEPKNPEWFAGRGLATEGRGDLDGAIRDYSQMIALQPDSDWAYASRAHAQLMKLQNVEYGSPTIIDAALKDATKAIELNGRNVYALQQRADAYCRKKQPAKALADLKTAEAAKPSDPDLVGILSVQAYCYRKLGKIAEAKAADAKANKLANQINAGAR